MQFSEKKITNSFLPGFRAMTNPVLGRNKICNDRLLSTNEKLQIEIFFMKNQFEDFAKQKRLFSEKKINTNS